MVVESLRCKASSNETNTNHVNYYDFVICCATLKMQQCKNKVTRRRQTYNFSRRLWTCSSFAARTDCLSASLSILWGPMVRHMTWTTSACRKQIATLHSLATDLPVIVPRQFSLPMGSFLIIHLQVWNWFVVQLFTYHLQHSKVSSTHETKDFTREALGAS